MSKFDPTQNGSGRHAIEFAAAIHSALGFRPGLRMTDAPDDMPEMIVERDSGRVRIRFRLDVPELAGELTAPDDSSQVLAGLVPLARKMLETELNDSRLRAEIAELNARNQRLADRAAHDPLTGLLNATSFRSAVDTRLRAARAEVSSVLILLDLDDFKAVNDSHGHAFGDAYLVAFAQSIVEVTRASDLTGRLGGDEFGVFLGAVTAGETVAEAFARRIRRAFQRRVDALGVPALGRSSLGAAFATGSGMGYGALFDVADTALYAAKAKGKDCLSISRLSA